MDSWKDYLAMSLLLGLILSIAAIITDSLTADKVVVGTGTVVQKVYSPATSGTGVGYGTNGNSGGPVVVSTSTSETWIVLIKYEGTTFSVHVSADLWGRLEPGQTVAVLERQGRLLSWGKTIRMTEETEE